jgi:hypothetical protein
MRILFWYSIGVCLSAVFGIATTFSPFSSSRTTRLSSRFLLQARKKEKLDEHREIEGPLFLRFSNNFQRHVVYQEDSRVVESFVFVDDAIESYPTAQIDQVGFQTFENELPDLGTVAGGGPAEQTIYRRVISGDELRQRTRSGYEALLTLSKFGTGSATGSVADYLADKVGKLRFLTHTDQTISTNYVNLLHLLNQIGFSPVVAKQSVVPNFPQICLYETKEVAERLRFLLSPLPPQNYTTGDNIDWPILASKGFGAGFTKHQVEQMLRGLPHVLAMHYEDAAQKPGFMYFHQALRVPKELCDEARATLRDQLDGATPSDVSMAAYIKSLGASWTQLRILLQAFPSMVTCDTDPSWIAYHKFLIRSVFKEHTLHYLQSRLQISPGKVQAMLKTHSRLSTYSVEGNILPTINALQKGLGLSSKATRRVLLRMPSLISMSIENGLEPRMAFFMEEVGLSQEEFAKLILSQPSLLQSSIEKSLRPKVEFFLNEMHIPLTNLRRIIVMDPTLLSLSLDGNLRPTSQYFMDYLEISWTEMGLLMFKNPDLLTSSWKRNLLPTLQFLRQRLDLSTSQLRELVSGSPRMVKYSIKTSLGPKIDIIQEALGPNGDVRQVVLANPTLLVLPLGGLIRRIEWTKSSERSMTEALTRRREKNSNNKVMRAILEICPDTNEVSTRYLNAKEAAAKLDITPQKLYGLCRSGKIFGGKIYAYETIVSTSSVEVLKTPAAKPPEKVQVRPKKVRSGGDSSKTLQGALLQSTYPLEREYIESVIPVVVYTAGGTYPPDNVDQVRGAWRAGGMSLLFPQVAFGGKALVKRLSQATARSFAQIMPEDEGGTNYNEGAILNGFPYLRPSRNRCELYACHDALKVILQLLKQEAVLNSDAIKLKVQVDIYTNSDYAWKLLGNSSRIIVWGSYESEDAVNYGGPEPESYANLDLLYPLAKTYTRLVKHSSVAFTAGGAVTPALASHIDIRFRHATSDGVADYASELAQKARKAATWHYQRATAATAMSSISM